MELKTIDAPRFGAMRQAMVTSQLRTSAVSDARVVVAMASVPREDFVPPERRSIAYVDGAIPLGRGRSLNPPMVTGRLLTESYLRAEHRVLLIGAATGYAAAVLALLVAEVVAVESDPTLAPNASAALAGQSKVRVVEGPLAQGHSAGAPYDALIVDGAVEELPQALLDQVAIGGAIATGLVDRGVTRLAAGRRSTHGFGLADFADAECVLLPGFGRAPTFRF